MLRKVFLSGFLVSASVIFSACVFPSQPSQPAESPRAVEESPGLQQDVSYEFIATESGTPAIDLVLAHVEVKTQTQAGKPTIVGINGLKADEEYSWQCYLNDQSVAPTHVSYLTLEEGDKLRFSFEN